MSRKRIVTLDRLSLRLPHGAARDPQAILAEVTRALGEHAAQSADRLEVRAGPVALASGSGDLARRIGRATAAHLKRGGGA